MTRRKRRVVETLSSHPAYLPAFKVWLSKAGLFPEEEIRAAMFDVPGVTEEIVDQILDRGREAEERHRAVGYTPKFGG